MVQGAIGECGGDGKYPTVFARLEDPEVMGFIKRVAGVLYG